MCHWCIWCNFSGGDEKQENFEEVLNLSTEQNSSSHTENNPSPIIAFDGSTQHTEGGDGQGSNNTHPQLHNTLATTTSATAVHDQVAFGGVLSKLLTHMHTYITCLVSCPFCHNGTFVLDVDIGLLWNLLVIH